MGNYRTELISPQQALPGRSHRIINQFIHAVNQTNFQHVPTNMSVALFAMGCFWGAEQLFWQQTGVYSTAVGYCGGYTPNPTYQEVCSGETGHAEAVQIIFSPEKISYPQLLQLFWENHDPTQGMRQQEDIGSQYRSMIFTLSDEQQQQAFASKQNYQQALQQHAQHRQLPVSTITTEIVSASTFYYAEDYHQQYLHKNPQAHCHIGGVGVCMLK